VTGIVLVPLIPVLLPVLIGRDGRFSPAALVLQLVSGQSLQWFLNSVLVSAATVLVTVAVAAPAGYALSRATGRFIQRYTVLIFGLQSLPAMLLLPPLFVLLVHVGAGNSLVWLGVLYVGFSLAIATWTMSAWFATLPIEVEEAAWLDGCSALGAFVRMVLPNSAPALISTAMITFLFAWNDYWIALLFIQDQNTFTVGLALVSGARTPALAVIALLPPVVVYLALHRWFRFGGVADGVVAR
jgi:multiple sugar transport system permease protein